MTIERIDWQALMVWLIGSGRLTPSEFWRLSLPELSAFLPSGDRGAGVMRRSEFLTLRQKFPDED